MKIDIIDDFLSDYHNRAIENALVGKFSNFPWLFDNNLNGKKRLGNYYFTYAMIDEGVIGCEKWLPIFIPLLDKLKIPLSNVYRLKTNLYPCTHRRVHHCTHRDYPPEAPLTTALYYVNTNNGITKFDGTFKSIKSKRNRIALFNGSNYHHSTSPTDSNYRTSVNIDYKL